LEDLTVKDLGYWHLNAVERERGIFPIFLLCHSSPRSKMAATMQDMIRLTGKGDGVFQSLSLPERMGNTENIAYGGCALSMVVAAAFQTVETPSRGCMALYSVLGHFIGPTLTDRTVLLRVTSLRDTRTFATRHVIASQKQDDGSERTCMSAQLDFISSPTDDPDVHSFLRYSLPPPQATSPAELSLFHEQIKDRVANGDLHPDVEKVYTSNFELFDRLFDNKTPSESPLGQNVLGIDKTCETSQDHLPLTSKRTIDYLRLKQDVNSSLSTTSPTPLSISLSCLHSASIAFALDGAIAFVPLSLSHHFLPDVAACSSLDFALRFHTDVVDLGKWHLREMRTIAGDYGRTFNESMLWDEGEKLVATMNQQGILRPHRGNAKTTSVEAKL
jgi:acyl-CoA thioesterase II